MPIAHVRYLLCCGLVYTYSVSNFCLKLVPLFELWRVPEVLSLEEYFPKHVGKLFVSLLGTEYPIELEKRLGENEFHHGRVGQFIPFGPRICFQERSHRYVVEMIPQLTHRHLDDSLALLYVCQFMFYLHLFHRQNVPYMKIRVVQYGGQPARHAMFIPHDGFGVEALSKSKFCWCYCFDKGFNQITVPFDGFLILVEGWWHPKRKVRLDGEDCLVLVLLGQLPSVSVFAAMLIKLTGLSKDFAGPNETNAFRARVLMRISACSTTSSMPQIG